MHSTRLTAFLLLASNAAVLASPILPSSLNTTCPTGLTGPNCTFYAVKPTLQTGPAGADGDDPTVWVSDRHARDSVVITTNKKGKQGLFVFDLEGKQKQFVEAGKPDNVDILYDVRFGKKKVDLAVTACRTDDTLCFFQIEDGKLNAIDGGVQPVEPGFEVYGSCVYQSPQTRKSYVFVNSKTSEYLQYEILSSNDALNNCNANLTSPGPRQKHPKSTPTLRTTLVRRFNVGTGGQVEGCVTDSLHGHLYASEESHGLWRFPAEPTSPPTPYLVDTLTTNGGHMYRDVEGVTLFHGKRGSGYILVSLQGVNAYAVYTRAAVPVYLFTFSIVADPAKGIDEVTETDGLHVQATGMGSFGKGLLVVHDDHRDPTAEDPNPETTFKYVSWESIAEHPLLPKALRLQSNPGYDPRKWDKAEN
ncbi:uncharacterized protein EV422DRAFT_587185 [Fimicolochytrium jonesii]|uniref:uncharacterized protein n=1 Tax=Fimicolochytrium jonesii TaxID=1396493 RepID=UPI0022FE4E32|nr:uncharacterized protein EV422DRAFT_587185 [Fimicolochytrium jonesii]KAI8821063.1 hypothetical protein EV422DRAFT_587185 [Fimicolochytrium jonesii]